MTWLCCIMTLILLVTCEEAQQLNVSEQLFGERSLCPCDLAVRSCDTSCCCDTDCLKTELQTFYCERYLSSSVNEVCFDGSDVFRSSLQLCTCNNPSLLCVIANNDPSSSSYGAVAQVETTEEFLLYLSLYPQLIDTTASLYIPSYASFYRVGDPLLQIVDGMLKFFSLPVSLNSHLCHDGNPVTYLASQDVICTRLLLLKSICTSGTPLDGSQYQQMTLLKYPVNVTENSDNADEVNITIWIRCSNSSCTLQSPLFLDDDTCINVLTEATFIFFHNGTGDISYVHVNLTLSTVNSSQATLVQRFVVRFSNVQDSEKVVRRSGNPGYKEGEPLLAGTYNSQLMEVALSPDTGGWLTVLGSSLLCSDLHRVNVLFNQDLTTACQLNVSTADLLSCNLSNVVITNLTSPSVDHVGIYGNSNASNISEWVPILKKPFKTETCTVLISTHLQVLYAYVGSISSPQATLIGVQVQFGTTNVFSLCQGTRCDDLFSLIPFKTTVTFVDVSNPPTQVLKSTTNFVKNLPHDFLYPLFASSSCISPCFVLVTVLLFGSL